MAAGSFEFDEEPAYSMEAQDQALVSKISISRKNAARSFCLGVRGIFVGLSLATFGAQGALSLEPSVLLRSKMPRPHDGVPNFHAVSERLYRSAQPTRNGFRELAAFGVKTVVSLRAFHADEPLLRGTEIDGESLFSDYKEVDGVMFPFSMRYASEAEKTNLPEVMST